MYNSVTFVYLKFIFKLPGYTPGNLNNHPYATSHLLGEQALIRITKDSLMQGHVLRLSNCFGYPLTQENDCWNLVLNEFIRDAFRLRMITIRGDCFGRRDFLPIRELNRILIKIIGINGFIPEIINISTGTSLTLLEEQEFLCPCSL